MNYLWCGYHLRMSDLGPKWVRLDPNGTNWGLFQIRFQYILAQPKRTEIWSVKVPDLSQLRSMWSTLCTYMTSLKWILTSSLLPWPLTYPRLTVSWLLHTMHDLLTCKYKVVDFTTVCHIRYLEEQLWSDVSFTHSDVSFTHCDVSFTHYDVKTEWPS